MNPADKHQNRHLLSRGWDHPRTAYYFERFCQQHSRYHDANRALVLHADLAPGQEILDLCAGTGRTAEAALCFLGKDDSIVCLESYAAMRRVGRARLSDNRIRWISDWPNLRITFNRILCGAAIWQLAPLAKVFRKVADLLAAGGVFAFNIPSLYLGEPEEPGGGEDPLLLKLPALLANGQISCTAPIDPLPNAKQIDALLVAAGLSPVRWGFKRILTQREYHDWLKIPVITEGVLPGMDPDQRARRVDEAFLQCDVRSWRWERWAGWTAQKETSAQKRGSQLVDS